MAKIVFLHNFYNVFLKSCASYEKSNVGTFFIQNQPENRKQFFFFYVKIHSYRYNWLITIKETVYR